jgi:hypothetical protein
MAGYAFALVVSTFVIALAEISSIVAWIVFPDDTENVSFFENKASRVAWLVVCMEAILDIERTMGVAMGVM